MAGGISVHVVDTTRGRPAKGMIVEVWRLGRSPRLLARGKLSATGTLDHPIVQGVDVTRGEYEVRFDAGRFFRGYKPALPAPPFLGIVPFRFGIGRVEEHFHLPMKISPWGYSLYRGG